MLRVTEFSTGVSHSASLNAESTCAQVVAALRRSDMSRSCLYVCWKEDEDLVVRARRLRGEDRPLHVVKQLQRAKISHASDVRLILADVEDEPVLARDGLRLDTGESDFFTLIERMGSGDECGYLETSVDSGPAKARWWVLFGERLWYSGHVQDATVALVPLAHAHIAGPVDAALEIQTALHSFRLTAGSRAEAQMWCATLKHRVQMATDNDLIAMADLMMADEELAASKAQAAMVDKAASSFEALVASEVGARLLGRFARRSDSTLEYVLWFYLDARNSKDSADAPGLLQRFCDLRGEHLAGLKQSVREQKTWSTQVLQEVLDAVRQELVDNVFGRFVLDESLLAELPLLVKNEI
jgi:hypothetical protein